MMLTKKAATFLLVATFAAIGIATPASADIIAGWNQNSNALPSGGFGFQPSDFPQPNDHGPASASHNIADFDATINGANPDNPYAYVQSFAGTTDNDKAGAGSGGSFSFQGGEDPNQTGDWSNNGAKSVFTVPTTNYNDIIVSWSQRGTSTGFTSRVFEYSSDGGTNWTDIGAYTHTDLTPASAGALSSTFKTVNLDLSGVTALNNNPNVMFRITYDGATSSTGNNRWDNFYVEGTLIPEPTSIMLVGMAFGLLALTRRK